MNTDIQKFMYKRFSIIYFFYSVWCLFLLQWGIFEFFATLERRNANFFIRFKFLSLWMSGAVLFVSFMSFMSLILFILFPSLIWLWASIWIIAKIPELSEDEFSELDKLFFCFLCSFSFFLCFLFLLFLFFFIFFNFLMDSDDD